MNGQGKIYYGMHFYPGVAEYQEPNKEPYRVFLNEDTIRSMDPSFAGRPIFVEHVDEVESDLNELRKEADGWVVESFYNAADGKHWVKFVIVSELGERAIKNGMRLSNAYIPTNFASGGIWNGVQYSKEITGGEYEHLAIVKNPRYEESVIMTPEEFKKYNEDKSIELKRLSNTKDKKGTPMKLNLFKRTKVENAADIEGISVSLPKSGKEMTLVQLVNEADEMMSKGNEGLADLAHKVKLHDGTYCNVAELVEKHKSLASELEEMKKKKEDEAEGESEVDMDEKEVDVESTPEMKENEDMDDDKKKENEDEEAEKEEKKKNDEAAKEKAMNKKKNDKEKADRLRNAHNKNKEEMPVARVEFSADMVARGKARYGSGN